MKSLFFGGVHPEGRKELSASAPLTAMALPAQVAVPLRQHIGAPCKPLVAVGETVCMGQKIGDGEGLCVPVHAPVSGVVEAIEDRPHPGGGTCPAIIIKNDFLDTPHHTLKPHANPEQLAPAELVSILRESGLVGMGGAAFPTDIKSKTGMGYTGVLILNACECEPYITADDALLRARSGDVLRGLALLARILNPDQTVIGIEDNKPEAAAILRETLKDIPGVELRVLPTRYPQGAEKQLIQAVTGRQVPSGGLPKDVGCAVFNAATAFAAYRAVYEGMPLIERVVTVTGEGVKEPRNLIVRVGTSFQEVIGTAGGLGDDVWKVLSGGPMMGVAQGDLSVPVTKAVNAVLCLSSAQNGESAHPVCIRCGKCLEVCPMGLEPLYLYRYSNAGDVDALKRLHLTDCIECGCCAYACPGKVPLVQGFRAGKRAMKEGAK
ncbi:MAG: electron transport complex subunit RsxC [Oscillospiraceae bacterium]|jgi:electron transport complex protein RnfC|nr:electron transport complex subunit RsxC [Oscillospiraceae bacterium]MCI9223284.1 electron transport complex subunit RsxC [Oscillospiraceae bacterium]